MEQISIGASEPEKYETVIVASGDTVKSAVYLGNGKFTTYLDVSHWMHMPESPKIEDGIEEQPTKKKRGRPKKV